MSFNPLNYDYEWTAIVALVAAGIALYGAWRANKIAEKNLSASVELEIIKFREKWIHELRTEMAAFSGPSLRVELNDDEYFKLVTHWNKVRLLMNPNDPMFGELMGLMATICDDVDKGNEEADNLVNYFKLCQKILKAEWERLKRDLSEYKEEK